MAGSAERVQDLDAGLENSPLFKGVEILGRRNELIIANVPVKNIDRSEMPVDPNHVREIVASMEDEAKKGMAESSGQLSPVLLGIIEGRMMFAIVDGFHRDAALTLRGAETILATIPPTMTEDELLDLRVITANMHETVSFARINRLVIQAWANTPWIKRIKAHQAFALAASKTMTGSSYDLNEEEASEIREWAKTRSEQWHMTPANIQIILSTAEFAAPDLTDAVRKRAGGSQLDTITQQHLGVITRSYPDQYGIQRALAGVIIENNLTTIEAKDMIESLEDTEPETLVTMILTTDWGARFNKGSTRRYTKRSAPAAPAVEKPPVDAESESKHAHVFDQKGIPSQYLLAQIRLARLSLENSVLRSSFVVSPLHDPHSSDFSIDYSEFDYFKEELHPLSGEGAVERVIARLEDIDPKLRSILYAQNLTPQQATHVINTIGQRVSRDIDAGVLKHISVKSVQVIDSLIRGAIESAVAEAAFPKSAISSSLPQKPAIFKLERAVKVNGEINHDAQTALALVGLMGANNHSTLQILGPGTTPLISTVHERLDAAERAENQIK